MPPTRRTLVLTGATGFIGSRVASYFAEHDWNVIALARNIPVLTKAEKTTTSNGWSIFPGHTIHLSNVLYSQYDLSSGEAIIPDVVDLFIHAAYRSEEHTSELQ